MKKVLFLILSIFVFNTILVAQENSDRWLEVGKTKTKDVYYLSYEIIEQSGSRASFWIKMIYGTEKPKFDNQLIKEVMEKVTFDFKNKTYRIENYYFFDFKGKQVRQEEGSYNFEILLPETIMEIAYDEARYIVAAEKDIKTMKSDSLTFVLKTADSLFSSDSFKKSLEHYFYAQNLIADLKSTYENKSTYNEQDNDLAKSLKRIEATVDERITRLNAIIKKQEEYNQFTQKAKKALESDTLQAISYLEKANTLIYSIETTNQIDKLKDEMLTNEIHNLVAKANKSLLSDTLIAIDYLEKANALKYNEDINNQIIILKEELTTSKIMKLVNLSNKTLATDTLLAIENLELAYKLRPNNDIKTKIESLKETYRINRLRFRLQSIKNQFYQEHNQLLTKDSLLRLVTLKKYKNVNEAYVLYFDELFKVSISYLAVKNYFDTGLDMKATYSDDIDPLFINYKSELATLSNLQLFIESKDPDALKSLNKALKNTSTLEDVKLVFNGQ
ncbi:MAG: hypothetical protein FGM14_06945 [Flavobacteriales bacterium]|nr:hypothetical protein [Flavobacteriales bacterium]